MTKIVGSGSINQRHESPDPDPYQNVTDPHQCIVGYPLSGNLSFSRQYCLITRLKILKELVCLKQEFVIFVLIPIRVRIRIPCWCLSRSESYTCLFVTWLQQPVLSKVSRVTYMRFNFRNKTLMITYRTYVILFITLFFPAENCKRYRTRFFENTAYRQALSENPVLFFVHILSDL